MAFPPPDDLYEYMIGHMHATSVALKILINTLPDTERAIFDERLESAKYATEKREYQPDFNDSPMARQAFEETAQYYIDRSA